MRGGSDAREMRPVLEDGTREEGYEAEIWYHGACLVSGNLQQRKFKVLPISSVFNWHLRACVCS